MVGLWGALLLGLGAVELSSGWTGAAATGLLVATAVAPLLGFAAAARLRVPTPVTALLVLALAAVGIYILVLAPSGLSVAPAVRDSLPRLLTAQRPAPTTPALLLPGVVAAVLVGTWVALRTVTAPVSARGRGLVAAPAGAIILYVGGALLTAGGADRTGVLGAAIVAVTATGWLILDGSPRARRAAARSRPHVALARPIPVALLVGATLAVALVAATGGGFEPRRLVTSPERTVSQASPLPELAAWHEHGDDELFRVSGATSGRLRLVTLSTYTGVAWSASATYRPVGVVAASTLPAGRQRTTTDADVTIAGLSGIWLPSLGEPVDVSLPNVDYEADGGSLTLIDGELIPGLHYTVRAEQDAATADEVAVAGVPAATDAAPLLALPRLPATFAAYARQITFGASTAFEQAAAIERAVGQGRRYDPLAPVGSSYARLDAFLFQPEGSMAGAQVGSSEQFSAAFAVLARSVGLPSRVVLGFNASPDGIEHGRDALAWPEVYFSGYGWYPFDPTPGTGDPAVQQVKLQALDRMDQQAEVAALPTTAATPQPLVTSTPPKATAPVAAAPQPSPVNPLAPLGAAAAVVLLAVGILAIARYARRARHRRAGVRGAWSEVLDLLVLMGRPAPRERTATDVAADLAGVAPVRSGAEHPAMYIAAMAERVAFAPPDVPADAGQAWAALARVRRAVRRSIPKRRRLLWSVDPRPLRRRPPRG
jgi:transglutaminase-like putative cysteine protease